MLGETLARLAEKDERIVAGYMSGTSMDGTDVAIVRIRGSGRATEARLIGFAGETYDPVLRRRLLNLATPGAFTGFEVTRLSYEVAHVHAEVLIRLAKRIGLVLPDIDLIGYHGVTLYHHGGLRSDIGEAAILAARTGAVVIGDLRESDCAAGGQGAPLSPYVDWILFGDPVKTRAVQNIGGIANVCAIPAGGGAEDLIGFDTGPGNMVTDGLVTLITEGNQIYDRDGAIAASGRVDGALLAELMAHPYIRRGLPKCTGREEFGQFFAADLLRSARDRGIADADTVATATAFTAHAIVDAYRRFISPRHRIDEVILGGGGIHNPVLMATLARLLAPVPVHTHDDHGIPSDAREALSWAILANETLHGHPANVPQVTGATRRVILGKITP